MRLGDGNHYLDLFSKPTPDGRDLVPVGHRQLTVVDHPASADPAPAPKRTAPSPLGEIAEGVDIRNVSPRRISDLGMELYAAGVLDWDEYSQLAFQPELHADYDQTIGALIGEKAEPDRGRDYVSIWEDRLAFEYRYNTADATLIRETRRILQVLRQFEGPTDVEA